MSTKDPNITENHTHAELTHEQVAHGILITQVTLTQGAHDVPHDIAERLRVARVRALEMQKTVQSSVTAAPAHKPSKRFNWASAFPAWLNSGLALGVFALVAVIATFSIRSDLGETVAMSSQVVDMAKSSVAPESNLNASKGDATAAATMQQAADSASRHTAGNESLAEASPRQLFATHHGLDNADGAYSAYSAKIASISSDMAPAEYQVQPVQRSKLKDQAARSTDDEIELILREQIPLQAYLNDDFVAYAAEEHGASGAGAMHR